MAASVRVASAVLALAVSTTIASTQTPPPPSSQPPASAPSAESVKKAEQALADARKALGGEKLGQIKTLIASGRTRRVRGNNLQPIDFEILIEQPDKYVRIDEFPAEDTDPTWAPLVHCREHPAARRLVLRARRHRGRHHHRARHHPARRRAEHRRAEHRRAEHRRARPRDHQPAPRPALRVPADRRLASTCRAPCLLV
jgi:hypothetical protein